MYDVDMGILNHMTSEYDIHWFFLNNEASPRVHRSTVERYTDQYKIKLYWENKSIKQLSPQTFFFYFQMAKKIRSINPDVIIKEEQDFYWSLVDFLCVRKKTVYMIHDVLVHSGTHHGWLRQLFTDLTIMINHNFITFSKSQQEKLINRYGHKKKLLLTHLSVKDFGVPTIQKIAWDGNIKLLFFGRIEYNKGLDLLIKGLENIYTRNININIELSICGKGSFWNECANLIKTPNKYNLQIRYIDNDEIPNLFVSHHFLVLPYRDTTQSGPLMIAANYNLPLLAISHESFMEIYNDNCAIYCSRIEDGLQTVLSLSKKQYQEIADNTMQLRELYSGSIIAKEIKEYLNSILE